MGRFLVDWIEQLFGIDPDLSSGALEMLIAGAIAVVIAGVIVVRRRRSDRREQVN